MGNMQYALAPDIKQQIDFLVDKLEFTHIKKENIHCIRSFDAKTRAYARIWGMSRLFKEVAGIEPNYIIEVIAKRFDKLNDREKIKTLIHELMHIPKTFSGALLSHRGPYHRINDHQIENLYRDFLKKY
jgi:predicted metallopeptidase